VRGTTTFAVSVADYDFAIVSEGRNVCFNKTKFANLSFNDGGILRITGDVVVRLVECDMQNISRATGSGVLVNSTSTTAVRGLTVLGLIVTNISVPSADSGGLFYLYNCSEILLSNVQGLLVVCCHYCLPLVERVISSATAGGAISVYAVMTNLTIDSCTFANMTLLLLS
jgi:hypothetical protein